MAKQEELNCAEGFCETGNTAEIKVKDTTTDRLIYFGDPMCSWCWGITNHLDALKSKYADQLGFELVLGGLRPGGGDAWTEGFRNMLKSHWQHVQDASGQPFDFSFFERQQFNYDTEPSALAVRVVRDLAPEKEWLFYKSLQHLFYAENKDISDLSILSALCQQLEIDSRQFETLFQSPGYKQLVQHDFLKAQQFGIRGFPSVVLKKGEEYFAVSNGYSNYERMNTIVEQILETSVEKH